MFDNTACGTALDKLLRLAVELSQYASHVLDTHNAAAMIVRQLNGCSWQGSRKGPAYVT